ncbi:Translation initiation factor 3 subunit b [Mortierella antarctica]|nr:Translation initiation factor 3 subunit b [Mortierella antarctica]
MASSAHTLLRQARSRCCCTFIPPYTLQHIADHGDVSERCREVSRKTLASIGVIHQARATAQAIHASHPPGSQGQGIIPPYVFQSIIDSNDSSEQDKERARCNLEKCADVKASRAAAAVPKPPKGDDPDKKLFRRMYTASKGHLLPGKELFTDPHVPTPEDDKDASAVYLQFKKIADFYRIEFQRDSIDGKGMDYIATVHFDDDDNRTPGYNNAFWNGKQWAFGDGDYEVFNSFSNLLDVTAHEVTHAITQYTAELEYEYQSGALNESISDVFASMIKQYYAPGGKQKAKDADWLIGKGIFLVPGAKALRDMANPGTAYRSSTVGKDRQVGSMKDFVTLPNTGAGDYGGVHINSGIPNRAFYLAATTLGEYSWEVAGKIWYASLTDPELQDVSRKHAFREFADITCKHAQIMGGQSWLGGVKQAWTTVGVL